MATKEERIYKLAKDVKVKDWMEVDMGYGSHTDDVWGIVLEATPGINLFNQECIRFKVKTYKGTVTTECCPNSKVTIGQGRIVDVRSTGI